MWLFYIYGNYNPIGSDGAVKVPKNVNLRKFAEGFRAGRPGRVYSMNNFTQEMCEMNNDRFVTYIIRNGKLLSCSEGMER